MNGRMASFPLGPPRLAKMDSIRFWILDSASANLRFGFWIVTFQSPPRPTRLCWRGNPKSKIQNPKSLRSFRPACLHVLLPHRLGQIDVQDVGERGEPSQYVGELLL